MLCVRHARKRHTERQAFARVLNLRSWPLRLHCREGKGKRKRKKNTARRFQWAAAGLENADFWATDLGSAVSESE